jgi:transposase
LPPKGSACGKEPARAGVQQEDNMQHYVGLDVSLSETAICVIDHDGIVIREGKVASEPEAITAWLIELDISVTRVGLEIGGLARWLYAELRAAGWPAICIDPRRLRGLTKTMPIKTDRNDARAIAQVMRVGWYNIVHIKSGPHQSQDASDQANRHRK